MKYFLAQDDSCHWYMIRADREEEWNAWLEQDYMSDDWYDHDDFAIRVGGWPGMIHFENPTINNKPFTLETEADNNG